MSAAPICSGGRDAGFSLIEVMVTVFVVSVGLLGVAGLQAISKKANYDAIQRTTAAVLAQSIVERIRANPSQGTVYAPAGGTSINQSLTASSCNPQPNAPLSATATAQCTPAQTAQYDLYLWSQELLGAAEAVPAAGSVAADTNLGGLQQPTGCITRTACGAVNVYTVAIAWRGLTPLPAAASGDPSTNTCGPDSAYPPPPTVSASMTMRRILVLQATIFDPTAAAATGC